MPRSYNNPLGGAPSSVGSQIRTDKFIRAALIELTKERYFGQLASTMEMPRNYGKKMKKYHYMPLLDDRNVNDEGIDATGAVIADGNLYGSSKDIGTVTSKLPVLGENGGRVNRVGFTRLEIESTLDKFGFFDEYTEESLNFDSDAELDMHITREMLRGANEITEDILQMELLAAAGVVFYAGIATQDSEITGEGADVSLVTFEDMQNLSITLTDNRCPTETKMITGTRYIDTKVVAEARFMMIGSELQTTVEKMTDYHGDPAFIGVEHYAAGTTVAKGEIGKIGRHRIVVVPEMMHWAGAGAEVTTNGGYRSTDVSGTEYYDIFPMLVVGAGAKEGSFTNIGFQTGGKEGEDYKFRIFNQRPGQGVMTPEDPYGETGRMSIKWYHGIMILRPEWIAVIKTVAPL